MSKSSASIEVNYKDGTHEMFNMPLDEYHAKDVVSLEDALVNYAGGTKIVRYTIKRRNGDFYLT